MGRRAQPADYRRKKRTSKKPKRIVLIDFSEANFDQWLGQAMRKVTPRRTEIRPA